jgi:hypothetical protein
MLQNNKEDDDESKRRRSKRRHRVDSAWAAAVDGDFGCWADDAGVKLKRNATTTKTVKTWAIASIVYILSFKWRLLPTTPTTTTMNIITIIESNATPAVH